MKNILTALVLFASFSASAQTYVGIKAGPSFGRAKNKLGTKDDFGLGFSTGAFIEHGYGKVLLVGAELLFENRITKVPFVHTDNLGNPISAPGKIESIYSAISLPVYVGFKSKLDLIADLERLVEDKNSNELHDLQPLFERGLWIFGPEFESISFTSNRTLATNVKKFFGKAVWENPAKRPDL